jgi:hypothetical protein
MTAPNFINVVITISFSTPDVSECLYTKAHQLSAVPRGMESLIIAGERFSVYEVKHYVSYDTVHVSAFYNRVINDSEFIDRLLDGGWIAKSRN